MNTPLNMTTQEDDLQESTNQRADAQFSTARNKQTGRLEFTKNTTKPIRNSLMETVRFQRIMKKLLTKDRLDIPNRKSETNTSKTYTYPSEIKSVKPKQCSTPVVSGTMPEFKWKGSGRLLVDQFTKKSTCKSIKKTQNRRKKYTQLKTPRLPITHLKALSINPCNPPKSYQPSSFSKIENTK
ncbi:unnamed protein product [Moneuplotes crassus]|uniref:Uncharacterized protein n=1 Tax=Euplotes crassus TaxID=5936 RepID=A0AAD1XAY1_EUPCR|nr:unnamed protein product [Moneuplotes crassus]